MGAEAQSGAKQVAGELGAASPLQAFLSIRGHSGVHLNALLEGHSLVVGRMAPADVCIADAGVSRQHARFSLVEGRAWVTDLDSRNGTVLGRERLPQRMRRRIYPGDELLIGSAVASLLIRPAFCERLELPSLDSMWALLHAEAGLAESTRTSLGVLVVRSLTQHDPLPHLRSVLPEILRPLDRLVRSAEQDDVVRIVCPGCDVHRAELLAQALVESAAPGMLGVGAACARELADAPHVVQRAEEACGRTTSGQPMVLVTRVARRRRAPKPPGLWRRTLGMVTWARGRGPSKRAAPLSLPVAPVVFEHGEGYEQALLRATMRLCGDNQVRAAAALRIPRRTLMHKLENHANPGSLLDPG